MARRDHGQSVVIGVDVGGTWVRAAVVAAGRTRRRIRMAVGRVPDLRRFVLTLAGDAPPPAALVVAAKGIWTAGERAELRRRLRGIAARVAVISDAEAAFHGALHAGPGVLLLAGTGSIVIGHDGSGRWARAGGLGPLLGDDGSAFAIGRAWLRGANGIRADLEARRLARTADAVRRIAALAPTVLRQARRGDRRARTIVREAQRDLARLTVRVVRDLGLRPPVALSWAGGVMADPWFRRGAARALRAAGLATRWVAPAAQPVDGAARLAEVLGRSPRHEATRGTPAQPGARRGRRRPTR